MSAVVAISIAFGACSASLAAITVAALRFTEKFIESEKHKPEPSEFDIIVSSIELRKCPKCGWASGGEKPNSVVKGPYLWELLHKKDQDQKIEAVKICNNASRNGPCTGIATPDGLWQGCASCGAEWMVVSPPPIRK